MAETSTSGAASTYQCTEAGSQMPVGTQHIYAVFSGDTNYGGSTSATITQVISMGATTTTVGDTSGTSDPSLAGIPTSYTATITPSQATAIEPTGTVVFYDNGSPIAGCTTVTATPGATNSTATCTEASLSMLVGSHLITAVYSGDANYITSDNVAAPFNQQVVQNTATTTVAGPGPGTYGAGEPLNFTATVTAGGIGLGQPAHPDRHRDLLGPLGQPVHRPGVCRPRAGVGSASLHLLELGLHRRPEPTRSPPPTAATPSSTPVPARPRLRSFVQATADVVIASSTAAHPTHGNASVQNAAVTYTATITNPYTSPSQGLVSPTGTATFYDTFNSVKTAICTVPVTPGAMQRDVDGHLRRDLRHVRSVPTSSP